MVTCELMGRLGNQLFQIAATIGYAKKIGMPYHIPAHTLNDSIWPPVFTNLTNEYFNPLQQSLPLVEPSHSYCEFPPYINSTFPITFIVKGYRQSYKYFEHCIDEVRKAAGVVNLLNPDSCAVHMRFGDYRNYPDKHPIMPKEYFDSAIDEMYTHGIKDFVFFSDEPDECHKYIASCHLPIRGVVYDSQNALESFLQLCTYENAIISNSSFSLMAAILCPAPEIFKKIISPDHTQWFGSGNAHLDTRDMIPPYFQQMKY